MLQNCRTLPGNIAHLPCFGGILVGPSCEWRLCHHHRFTSDPELGEVLISIIGMSRGRKEGESDTDSLNGGRAKVLPPGPSHSVRPSVHPALTTAAPSFPPRQSVPPSLPIGFPYPCVCMDEQVVRVVGRGGGGGSFIKPARVSKTLHARLRPSLRI